MGEFMLLEPGMLVVISTALLAAFWDVWDCNAPSGRQVSPAAAIRSTAARSLYEMSAKLSNASIERGSCCTLMYRLRCCWQAVRNCASALLPLQDPESSEGAAATVCGACVQQLAIFTCSLQTLTSSLAIVMPRCINSIFRRSFSTFVPFRSRTRCLNVSTEVVSDSRCA